MDTESSFPLCPTEWAWENDTEPAPVMDPSENRARVSRMHFQRYLLADQREQVFILSKVITLKGKYPNSKISPRARI